MATSIIEFIPERGLSLINMSNVDLVDRIGENKIREIIFNVLCGENIRDATEPLTRHRIAALNAAVLVTIAHASTTMNSVEMLEAAKRDINELPKNDPRTKILRWIIGLTVKQIQNILRSDDAWNNYLSLASEVLKDSTEYSEELYGWLDLEIRLGSLVTNWDWFWTHSLLTAIGSQTLSTRGAEKSLYGKFFEKGILGSVLEILGFKYDEDKVGQPMTFWLSERGEKRESDATAIIDTGLGVRFDIGFIGPGNTEITLDKASRFGTDNIRMATIIIIDRVGRGSTVLEQAKDIGASIIQMSSSLWVKTLDRTLYNIFENNYQPVFSPDAGRQEIKQAVFESLSYSDLQVLFNLKSKPR